MSDREPLSRQCPRCHGTARRDLLKGGYYCYGCQKYLRHVAVEEAAKEDLVHNPAYDVPEETQRWWLRALLLIGRWMGRRSE